MTDGQMLREALRDHRCLSDGAMLVGECVDSGRCGCTNGLLLAAPPSSTPSPTGEGAEEWRCPQCGVGTLDSNHHCHSCGYDGSPIIDTSPTGEGAAAGEENTQIGSELEECGRQHSERAAQAPGEAPSAPEACRYCNGWGDGCDKCNGTGRASPAAGEVEQIARALHALDCHDANEDCRREKRTPPEKWADPWHPGGIRQLEKLRARARVFLAALRTAPSPETEKAKEALEDLRTHASAWRNALVNARERAEVFRPDTDDRSYWQHEIESFDRVIRALAPSCPRCETMENSNG
jgi:hypothetical protein